jgi:hypothetical protein
MNKKITLIALIIMFALLFAETASAMIYGNYYPYGYGNDYPINPAIEGRYYQYSNPARTGGFFGANSAFLTNLKPGYYAGPMMNYGTRYGIASSYYPRVGGFFGYRPYTYYYGLRSGTFSYY